MYFGFFWRALRGENTALTLFRKVQEIEAISKISSGDYDERYRLSLFLDEKYLAPELFDDWRETDRKNWSYATWANTYDILDSPYNVFPEKTIMVGHWWAWSIAEKYGEIRTRDARIKDPLLDCSTYIHGNKAIFLDGCANYKNGGCVNVYVYESDAEPTFIK